VISGDLRGRVRREDPHVQAIYSVPELHDCHCKKTGRLIGYIAPEPDSGSVRTEIQRKSSGIVVVHHHGGKLGQTGRGVGNPTFIEVLPSRFIFSEGKGVAISGWTVRLLYFRV
jgi:hypothetical protein